MALEIQKLKLSKRIKKSIVRWLLKGVKLNSFQDGETIHQEGGLNDTYLFDFKNFASQYNSNSGGFSFTVPSNGDGFNDNFTDSGDTSKNSTKSIKIKIKPIEVLNELEIEPTPILLTMLDEKIEVLKDKSKLITQSYAKREIEGLLERLINRKKYTEHKEYFDKFQNTTDEKIDLLLEKYDLVMKTSDIFVPEFPDIAIERMKAYTEKMDLVCGKKPVFYVIAEAKDFKKAYEKRDPILLVQSPFGFYWQILGAWNEEMILLSEL